MGNIAKKVQAKGGLVDVQKFLLDKANDLKAVVPIKDEKAKEIFVQAMVRVTLRALSKDSKLAQCTQISRYEALLDCATVGLIPFTVNNEAYIIPYKNVATFQFGYRGLLKTARRYGSYKHIYADIVRENDLRFDVSKGDDVWIEHKPLLASNRERGEIKFFYAVYELKSGEKYFEVMAKEDVDKHRDKYVRGNIKDPDAVWNKEYEAMGMKTVLKKLFKFAPNSSDFLTMVSKDMELKRELAPSAEDFTPEREREYADRQRSLVEGFKPPVDVVPEEEEDEGETEPMTRVQEMFQVAHDVGVSIPKLKDIVTDKYDVDSLGEISEEQADEMIEMLQRKDNKKGDNKKSKGSKKVVKKVVKEADDVDDEESEEAFQRSLMEAEEYRNKMGEKIRRESENKKK
jgi:recombination protein RecT